MFNSFKSLCLSSKITNTGRFPTPAKIMYIEGTIIKKGKEKLVVKVVYDTHRKKKKPPAATTGSNNNNNATANNGNGVASGGSQASQPKQEPAP